MKEENDPAGALIEVVHPHLGAVRTDIDVVRLELKVSKRGEPLIGGPHVLPSRNPNGHTRPSWIRES